MVDGTVSVDWPVSPPSIELAVSQPAPIAPATNANPLVDADEMPINPPTPVIKPGAPLALAFVGTIRVFDDFYEIFYVLKILSEQRDQIIQTLLTQSVSSSSYTGLYGLLYGNDNTQRG